VNKRTVLLILLAAVVAAVRFTISGLRSHQQSRLGKWTNRLVEALQTGRPTGTNPYWRTVPLRRTTRLLVGVFLLGSVGGFAVDLIVVAFGHRPLLRGFYWPLIIAPLATCARILRLKKPRWAAFARLPAFVIFLLALPFQFRATGLILPSSVKTQFILNAVGISIGTGLGLWFIMSFLTTEGVASVRMQTELTLAQGIQATLVPPISLKTPRFEVFGISLPSTEVGGDLVDALVRDGELVAYVADISGHGLPAGQLMGMLKTAMRVSMELRQPPVALLENADRVLPSLKEPDMYATLALLGFDDSREAEYCLAGHPPILHYRKSNNDVASLAMQQFPIGLLGTADYVSVRTSYLPGDLFVILTDGIVEVANQRGDEFGLRHVEKIVIGHAAEPLVNIWDAIRAAASAHGPQQDDQSVLIVRAREY